MSFFTGRLRKPLAMRSAVHREQAVPVDLPLSQSAPARAVLSEAGQILQMEDAFQGLLSAQAITLNSGEFIQNYLPNFECREGSQMIFFGAQRFMAYGDWVESADGQRVLVISLDQCDGLPSSAPFASRIMPAQKSAQAKNPQQQKLLDFQADHLIIPYQKTISIQQKRLKEAEVIGNFGRWEWMVGQDRLEFSAQLYKIFGMAPEQFSPSLSKINAMIHPDDSDRMMQIFQRAVIEQKDYDMDFRLYSGDGQTRHIRCEGRCQTDRNGEVIALYGIMQDISDLMQRETDLRRAKDIAERAYAAKSQFLANMSHELRTPLNAVIGFSEMMERQLLGPIGNDRYLDYIKGIRESGEHLLDLISDILDMSKIEAGKYELALEKIQIAKLIRLAAHMMEGRALDHNLKIHMDIRNEDLKIVADRRAVLQIILNVLSNAVKFSKPNGEITISLLEREAHVSIKVQDNGIGIPATKLANIMVPFEQVGSDYSRPYEGTGLGLSITKELVELHGGQIHIESQIHVGTCVTIRLPYHAQQP